MNLIETSYRVCVTLAVMVDCVATDVRLQVGRHQVIFNAHDAAGNRATCSYNIYVRCESRQLALCDMSMNFLALLIVCSHIVRQTDPLPM